MNETIPLENITIEYKKPITTIMHNPKKSRRHCRDSRFATLHVQGYNAFMATMQKKDKGINGQTTDI